MKLRIKEICKEKGILQKDLAEALGISDISLRASLKGNPTVGTLEKVANALGVSVTELFKPKVSGAMVVCPHCGGNVNLKVE